MRRLTLPIARSIMGCVRSEFKLGVLFFLVFPVYGQNWWLQEAGDGARVIVETGVKCDVLPTVSIDVPIGIPIRGAVEIKEAGETFYSGYPMVAPNSRCRVYGASTAVWHKDDPDSLLFAILDHALARKDAKFEDLVDAENYLIKSDARWKTQAGRERVPGKLLFRWLQLINRAVGLKGFDQSQSLVESWILNHRELLEMFQPRGEWYVPAHHFWHVYEMNSTAQWAEELAWFVANLPVQHDECEATCILDGYIGGRVLQYWIRFPSGPHIGDALTEAWIHLKRVDSGTCDRNDLKLLTNIRDSLSRVTHPLKKEIFQSLTDLERACAK